MLCVSLYHKYTREIPEPAPYLSRHWGYSCFFRDQNNRDSSGAYVLWSKREINMRETPHGVRRSWTYFVCVCFLGVWSAKTRVPPIWAPMADNAVMAVYEVWDLQVVYLWFVHKTMEITHLLYHFLLPPVTMWCHSIAYVRVPLQHVHY